MEERTLCVNATVFALQEGESVTYWGQHWASVDRGSFLSTVRSAHRHLLVGPQETLSILMKSEASFYKCISFLFLHV